MEARRRLDLIQPVLDAARLPRSVMSERARAGGVEVTTLYRWARLYRATGLFSSLLHPPMSIWELRELRGKLHEAGRAHIDEAAIFEAYRRLREREARAVSEIQRTRRARARRPQSVRREAAVVPSAATKV